MKNDHHECCFFVLALLKSPASNLQLKSVQVKKSSLKYFFGLAWASLKK